MHGQTHVVHGRLHRSFEDATYGKVFVVDLSTNTTRAIAIDAIVEIIVEGVRYHV
jgi:hypothetical protein